MNTVSVCIYYERNHLSGGSGHGYRLKIVGRRSKYKEAKDEEKYSLTRDEKLWMSTAFDGQVKH